MPASCDLHVHSVYSEGALTPGELVMRAKKYDVRALVLTDHNAIGGIPEFILEAATQGIEAMSGVEIYASFEGKTLHVLGYGFDHKNSSLRDALQRLQQYHMAKFSSALDALSMQGFVVEKDFFQKLPTQYPGFSHIVSHVQQHPDNRKKFERECGTPTPELFTFINRYCSEGKPAYLPQTALPLEECVQLISGAGGVAILAHPGQQIRWEEEKILHDAIAVGVEGIEVFSPYHTWHQIEHYQKLAISQGWLMTGGLDFHTDIGLTKKEPVANQWDLYRIPYQLFTELRNHAKNV